MFCHSCVWFCSSAFTFCHQKLLPRKILFHHHFLFLRLATPTCTCSPFSLVSAGAHLVISLSLFSLSVFIAAWAHWGLSYVQLPCVSLSFILSYCNFFAAISAFSCFCVVKIKFIIFLFCFWASQSVCILGSNLQQVMPKDCCVIRCLFNFFKCYSYSTISATANFFCFTNT